MKRLLIDIEKCCACKDHKCVCSYPHRAGNNGVDSLFEEAVFAFVCRQCKEAPCIAACPNLALEKFPDANLQKHNARCVSCKSCMLACPFGALRKQVVPYLSSKCDFCAGRLRRDESPVCVSTCPHGALEYVQPRQSRQKNVYFLGDNLAVRCIWWRRQDKNQ